MTFETWLAFSAASMLFLIFPIGPTILLVITFGLSNGPRVAPVVASGVALGDFTAMTVSLAGLGAVMMASAEVFQVGWGSLSRLAWHSNDSVIGQQRWPDGDERFAHEFIQDFPSMFCRDSVEPQAHRVLHRVCASVHQHD